MGRVSTTVLIAAFLGACGGGALGDLASEGAPCDIGAARSRGGGDVVVEAIAPACGIAAVEVATLNGVLDQPLARFPAVASAEAIYSATWDVGTVAAWSPDGSFLRSFGRGRGGGPGEFEGAVGLSVIGDTVVVHAGDLRSHYYSKDGDFLRTVNTRASIGTGAAVRGDTIVSPTMDGTAVKLVGDAVIPFDAPVTRGVVSQFRIADDRLWMASALDYALVELSPEGEPLRTIRRSVPWFSSREVDRSAVARPSPGLNTTLVEFWVDDDSRAWVVTASFEVTQGSEMMVSRDATTYRIEVFSLLSGELLGSVSLPVLLRPIMNGLWAYTNSTDEAEPLHVVQLRLVEPSE